MHRQDLNRGKFVLFRKASRLTNGHRVQEGCYSSNNDNPFCVLQVHCQLFGKLCAILMITQNLYIDMRGPKRQLAAPSGDCMAL